MPLEVLWSGDKANLRRRKCAFYWHGNAGESGNPPVLSGVPAPSAEKRLLQVLTAGGDYNPLISEDFE